MHSNNRIHVDVAIKHNLWSKIISVILVKIVIYTTTNNNIIYLGRFIRKSAKKQIKRNKADKNMNTKRLCGKNLITNKKYLIYTAKRSHNRKKNKNKITLMSDQN